MVYNVNDPGLQAYSVSQVAKMFSVTAHTVRTWLNSDPPKLRGGKINGTTWRIPKSEVDRLANEMYGERK